jgi:hypothetical protein
MDEDQIPLRYVDFDGKIQEVSAEVLDNLDSFIPNSVEASIPEEN